ncbi:MAG: GNAT family N-acetyltransferase [Bacteroidales bacterium]
MNRHRNKLLLYSALTLMLTAIVSKQLGLASVYWIPVFSIAILLKCVFLLTLLQARKFKLSLPLILIIIGVGFMLTSFIFKTAFPILWLHSTLFYGAIALKITGLILAIILSQSKHSMNQRVIIRQEESKDIHKVFELHKLAFGQDAEARLVDAIRANPSLFVPELSIVATDEKRIIGHILLSKIKINDKEQTHESLALAPISVMPDLQKQGIGKRLIKKGLETAQSLGFTSVIVLGHEQYYPKFGFTPAERWSIKAPFDVPSTAFMAIELQAEALKGISGTVIYPKEFESV